MTLADLLDPYRPALLAALGVGFLFMAQTLVLMATRVRRKHRGGVPIETGHECFLFRADRARANTYEVLGFFAVALLVAMSLGAPPAMVNAGAMLFLAARVLHMATYYANLDRPRSVFFMAGNLGVIILLVGAVRALA